MEEPRFRAEPFGARKASAGRTEEISGPKEKKKKASWLASVPGIGRWKIKLLGQRRKKTNQTNTNIPRLKAYLSPLSPTITVRLPRRSRVRAAINA